MRKTIELYSDKYKRKIPISVDVTIWSSIVDDIRLGDNHTCEDCSITEEEVESIVCRDEILIREIIAENRSANGKKAEN